MMLARVKPCLFRSYQLSYRWMSKEMVAIKPKEITKFLESTDNPQDTLKIDWHQMTDLHKSYFQNALKQNEPIKFHSESNKADKKKKREKDKSKDIDNSNQYNIDHIVLSNTDNLTNNDALNVISWINTIIASPDNKLKSINIDLVNDPNSNIDSSTNEQIIDNKCITELLDAICSNPNKSIELESLEFKSVNMDLDTVQYIFDTIRYKCRYCEYLSLENSINDITISNSSSITNIIYHYYYDNDFYGLRNTSLSEIDLYGNKFEFSWIFHYHALVTLNRRIKKFLRQAIKSYGDFLLTEDIVIHTNDPYFRYCIFPQLRMTLGTVSREYSSFTRDIVRFNRRNWNEESLKHWRKIGIIAWFLLTIGIAISNIARKGKQSWWFKVAEFAGLDSVKKRRRDPNEEKKKKKRKSQRPLWKRIWE